VSVRCLLVLAAAAVVAGGCGSGTAQPPVPGAHSANGKRLIEYYGCGACHVIAGITPQGRTGPSLVSFAGNRQIAGTLPNTAANLVRWIERPQRIRPGNDMPDLGIGPPGAKDIAAYLYEH
jgi:cytochrome c2